MSILRESNPEVCPVSNDDFQTREAPLSIYSSLWESNMAIDLKIPL